jgi:DNA-binding LacI/PurR family transcriptional regulator
VVAKDLSEQSAYEAIKPVLVSRKRPDAVFCIHDQLAIGALRAAADIGVGVPQELGVVGVTDTLVAEHARPPLTSVRVFPEQAGRAVVELIDQLIREENEIEAPRIIGTKLVERASTARS